jgi:hypothetical protein
MSKDWWTILRFAILGVALAAVFFAFFETNSLVDSSMGIWVVGAALILCPGFIPFAWAASVEMELPSFKLILLIVGLINCVIYAALGAVYVRFRLWRAGTVRI